MIKLILSLLIFVSARIYALGMQPETSALIINQKDGEASISVKNTNDSPSLLQTKIIDIDDNKGTLVLASPPIVKIQNGEEQIIRFFLQSSSEIKNQQIKRIRFIGLPAKSEIKKDSSEVLVSVSQSIPLIINPAGLAPEAEPWKFLSYRYSNGNLIIHNQSRYVVRLYPQIKVNGKKINLSKSFISPAEKIEIDYKELPSEVKIKPVGLYGEVRDEYKIKKDKI
ncbi:fimbria/pilus chaperone family protein (plasmid) [Cronobacter sakazakii]|uniref:fimbria/pilus chaperone family protein n=1 Tax=Cronobacter sakazakii TaxID=28141 RepID=UPI003D7A631E